MYLLYEDRNDYSIRPDTAEQREIYNYVRSLTNLPPQEAIDAFYRLLWNGNTYPHDEVKVALQKVIADKDFEEHKLKIINRCYYTLVNCWHLDSNRDQALAEIILWLEKLPTEKGHSFVTRSLRDTLRTYRDSDYYNGLKKNLYLVDGWQKQPLPKSDEQFFEALFPEYFFLYEAGIKTYDIENAVDSLSEGILQKRNQRIQHYRQDLGRFYNSVTRSVQTDIPNPTQQLTHKELYDAIKLYNPSQPNSLKVQAEGFKAKVKPLRTVGEWKPVIYQHVMQPVQALSPNHQRLFSREFVKVLDTFQDDLPMTPVIEIRIFSCLVNAIARSADTEQEEERFSRFVNIAGPQVVTSLLLKMVLTCRMVRFELEKRLAYLHHKFAKANQGMVKWLVKAFDHLNVALALNAEHLKYFLRSPTTP